MQTVIEEKDSSQGAKSGSAHRPTRPCGPSTGLSPSDRRLILISSLSLYLRRVRHNIPVTSGDLLRLAPYADSPSPDIEAAV
jgi:hypothetical protein